MPWKKASPELIQYFDTLLAETPGADKRKMFGYPVGYVKDVWFIGCYDENDIVLRLSAQDRAEFLSLDGAREFEPRPGRPMKEFVVVPLWIREDRAQMTDWVAKSLRYASTLQPKPKGKRGK